MSMDEKLSRQDGVLWKPTDATAPQELPSSGWTYRSAGWPIWSPLTAIVVVSLFIRIFEIDLKVSRLCYDAERSLWPFETAEPWLWFYRNGTIPPLVVGIAGAIVFAFGSSMFPRANPTQSKRIRRNGLFLALLLVIGPGLLVNSSLKMLWGRPRPLQCEQFGGAMKFLPVGDWGTHNLPNSSFPSGHAAVAFFLMGLGFIVSPGRPWLRGACFLGGMAYGIAMGFTRVMQGGHFTSDVLWAGAIVYFVAVGLDRVLIEHE